MHFQYKVFDEPLYLQEFGNYIGYGIAVFEVAGNRQRLLAKYSDIFIDKKVAENFALLCTEEAVEPIHFLEILEDFLP